MIIEQNHDYDEGIPRDPWADDVDAMFDALVARLEGINPFRDALDRLAEIDREEAARFAERAQIYSELVSQNYAEQNAGASWNLSVRSVAAEVAISGMLSDRTIQSRLSEALSLVGDYPITFHALQSGRVSVPHARVVMEEGYLITDPESKRDYESDVLDRADSVTPGRLRRIARSAAQRHSEGEFEERHEKARNERSVRCYETADGMSEIVAAVPTVLASGIMDRLTRMGKSVTSASPHDPRHLDQIRADLLCDLVLTGQASGEPHAGLESIRAEVTITIPALTLLGRGDEPASILGGGPIGLADARQLAADAPSLIRVLTHPVTAQVLATDSYRPGEQLRRYLRTRDGRCRFPTCNQTVWRCDIDHTIPYSEGGGTASENLAHLCPGHHTIKHLPGWRLRQSEPGVLHWSAPHGATATDRPENSVRFSPG